MSHLDHPHLDSDQLLQAVVSESDLPPDLRGHLTQCHHCRQEVDRLAARFGAIGRMAREISPDALGRVRLPEKRRRTFLGRRVGLRPALGMAVAMVLLLMIVVYQPLMRTPGPALTPPQDTATRTLSPEAEAQLFAEIQALLVNPLPEDYQELAGKESPLVDAEDITDFIVPEVEADTDEELGAAPHTKGTA